VPARSSSSDRPKASPVKVIDTHEEIVRGYLESLEQPPEAKAIDPTEVTRGITDPIAKLRALNDAKQRADISTLEDRFVEVAARWATKNRIERDTFALLGVPAGVLRRAFGAPPGKHGRIKVDELEHAIRAKPKGSALTVASIARELGGSPVTIRRLLDRLVEQQVVTNEGPDPNYKGRGRAPIVFTRR
jgi:hypothetical protein